MSNTLFFSVKSGIKSIVGKDLIIDDNIAIFELVKNSYDAHAKKVIITFEKNKITIADNGKGMSLKDVNDKWLALAYSAKKDGSEDEELFPEETDEKRISYRDEIQNKRFYAGAKGIGRFSSDRLGSKLKLITKKEHSKNIEVLDINWKDFEKNDKQDFIKIPVKHDSVNIYKIPFFRLESTYHDTNKSYSFDDSDANLSNKIIDKISKTINSGNQVIVFLPTRANFKYQICTTCGKSVECPYCSVSMSLHKNDLALKCHYCGYAQQIPDSCPSCHNGIIHNLRVGTAQIEEELKELFPQKTIRRFDRDEIKTNKQLKTVLNEFNKGQIDILVGTQMLSKGHDYHNVKLAVVLGIDSVLNMNSYKAREKALSLLIQISGRSGRKGEGEVIIQTKNEDFFNFYLNESNYKEFLESELEFRKELYPPFLKMAKITFSHANGLKIKDEMDSYVHFLKQNKDIEVVGFGQSPIFKMANKYRYEILIRSNNINALLNALHSIQSPNVSIDMDTIY